MVVPTNMAASAFIINKKLPYTNLLNHQISKLRGHGIMQHLLERHATKKPFCQTEEKLKSIHFKKVIFPLFVYMIGVISALAIFFIENIIAKRNEKVEIDIDIDKGSYSKTVEVGVQFYLIS